jgi:hypothetical protein
MMPNKATIIVECLLLLTLASDGQPIVTIESPVAESVFDGVFARGQLVPFELLVRSAYEAPVFAIDFELNCTTSDVSIASITVNPAFSHDLDGQGIELSDCHARVRRSQPSTGFDPTLGAMDQPVLLATVELEVLSAAPFLADLEVSARVSLLGDRPARYVILGQNMPASPIAADQPPAILTIVNGIVFEGESGGLAGEMIPGSLGGADGAVGGPVDVPPEVLIEQAELAIEVRRPADGQVVTELLAGQTYELHYAASPLGSDGTGSGESDPPGDFGSDGLASQEVLPEGYAVFAISDSPTQRFEVAAPPAAGPWSATGWFFHTDFPGAEQPYDAIGFPDGYHRNAMISDEIWPLPQDAADPDAPAPTGHLCTFTPAEPGQIALQVLMYQSAAGDEPAVEMVSVAELSVQPSSP